MCEGRCPSVVPLTGAVERLESGVWREPRGLEGALALLLPPSCVEWFALWHAPSLATYPHGFLLCDKTVAKGKKRE